MAVRVMSVLITAELKAHGQPMERPCNHLQRVQRCTSSMQPRARAACCNSPAISSAASPLLFSHVLVAYHMGTGYQATYHMIAYHCCRDKQPERMGCLISSCSIWIAQACHLLVCTPRQLCPSPAVPLVSCAPRQLRPSSAVPLVRWLGLCPP
jgi:hypothetical protein